MHDPWIENEWDDLCERLARCAEEMDTSDGGDSADRQKAASDFASNGPPSRYPELLERVAKAAALAISWQSPS